MEGKTLFTCEITLTNKRNMKSDYEIVGFGNGNLNKSKPYRVKLRIRSS